MALINGNTFRKITQRYRCAHELLGEVREFIYDNYYHTGTIGFGRCLVSVPDQARRWIIPQREDKYYDLAFAFRGIPGNIPITRKTYLHLVYEAAEELTQEKYDQRIDESYPDYEVLEEAKKIINPTFKYYL